MYDELVKRLRTTYEADVITNHGILLEAADAIEGLSHAVDQMTEWRKKQWIPVTERLPGIGKKVLVFAYGHDVLTARLCKQTENDYPVFECNGIYLEMAKPERITHWMPLPKPPEDGEA